MLAEMALMDLHFAAASLAPNPPAWIQRLDLCAENERLPNKDMLDRREPETEVEPPAPDLDPAAADLRPALPTESPTTVSSEPILPRPTPAAPAPK